MELFVKSKFTVLNCNPNKPYIVISISNNASLHPDIPKFEQCKGIYHANFADITEPEPKLKLATKEDAQGILDFVNSRKDTIEAIVVHCDGGICRSSAVAAALAKMLGEDESVFWNSNIYYPNMHVYSLMLEACFGPMFSGEIE